MISQGFHGVSAAGKFPVRGIIKHVSPELNKTIIYMSLPICQEFFGAENRLTSLVVNIKDGDLMRRTLRELKNDIQSPYAVMSWEEMQPEVVQQIESDRASGVIMKAILYLVIAFGVLGTIMMMIAERKREFGVMVSVGMKKGKLATILLYETILIGFMGIASGVLVALPLIQVQKANPLPLTGQAAQMMEEFGFEPYMFFFVSPGSFLPTGNQCVYTNDDCCGISDRRSLSVKRNKSVALIKQKTMIASIAWRNIWRSPVRSGVIISAIAIGMFAGVFTTTFYKGWMDQRLEAGVETEVSHIQIHDPKFTENYELKKYIPDGVRLSGEILQNEAVNGTSPRIVIQSMIASSETGTGVRIIGINPEKEKTVTICTAK